jgi:hypothetical protein
LIRIVSDSSSVEMKSNKAAHDMNALEFRRGFRLHALHVARQVTARQSLANEALLVWSHPNELFITHAELPGRTHPQVDPTPK